MGKSPGLKLQASIVQDNVPIEVTPGLFVGSIHAAFNVEALKDKKITHILNLAGTYSTFPDDFAYLSVSIRDKEYSNLLSCLPVAAVFIEAGVNAGGVLIHCAGGRSRSPAVAISYLMMKDKMPYDSAVAHVKALRPVVSLNTGFETQLKCLERAACDVFTAHQLHLQHKLTSLVQKHLDGTLEMASVEKKRRQHSMPHTPPHPSIVPISTSRCEPVVTCCDDRGMLDGNLPSGFCLTLPFTSKTTQFIPALRSMGSMFGCRSCGEHLFCAGAVVQHIAEPDRDQQPCASDCIFPCNHNEMAASVHETSGGCDDLDQSATKSKEVDVKTLNISAKQDKTEGKKKRAPLLAKLRLRPQSPSVSAPSKPAKSTPRAADGKSGCCTEGDSRATTVEKVEDAVDSRGGVLRSAKKDRNMYRSTASEREIDAAVKNTSNNKTVEGIWRTLVAFKATKRIFKDGHEKKHAFTGHIASGDKKQVKALDFAGVDDIRYAQFLQANASAWEQSFRMIEKSSDEESAAFAQVSAVIAADSKRMSMFDCNEWFIEPQAWFLDHIIKNHSGAIRCPNEGCNAVVGQWHWDGLRCSCGGKFCSAIQMKKNAIKLLGNMTSAYQKGAASGVAPEQDVSLFHRRK